jgi:putative ABC transport system permease protein
VTLTGEATPVRAYGTLVSADYFDVLGVRPVLGRAFSPEEEREPEGAPVVVISYRFWQSHFGGSAGVIGQSLEINRRPYTIVGVASPRFQGAKAALPSDLWIPLMMARSVWGTEQLTQRDNDWLDLVGRLRPGAAWPRRAPRATASWGTWSRATPTRIGTGPPSRCIRCGRRP